MFYHDHVYRTRLGQRITASQLPLPDYTYMGHSLDTLQRIMVEAGQLYLPPLPLWVPEIPIQIEKKRGHLYTGKPKGPQTGGKHEAQGFRLLDGECIYFIPCFIILILSLL